MTLACAAEVKALASQTTKATDSIARHIDGIHCASHQMIANVVSLVSNVATEIAAAVQQLDATTMGISNSMQPASGTLHMESNLSTVANVADRTNQAAIDAEGTSSDVTLRTAELRGVVREFLEQVAA
ncbi:hypothetical protein AOQ73_06040 [Bradyrhizobium pachyrhizi]|uniref:hypothetical protein n=1 Tax=Bradyrhizobium pachyrhizi TaxID=280333 RepID=UPI0007052F05|nr:hypothetical protein [Bradyrhizobium pachyrhizi]KRQ11813.1 hypothetical protein AOQ73_06040 [Bradyrhizobium pachyrhizi]